MKKLLIIIIIIGIIAYVGIERFAGAAGTVAGKAAQTVEQVNTAENRAKVKATVSNAAKSAKRAYEDAQAQ